MAAPEGFLSIVLVAACAIVAPAVFGLGIVRWLGLAPDTGQRLAWAFGYLVGHYALAHGTAAWLALGQPFPGLLLPIGAATAGIGLVLRARRRRTDAPIEPTPIVPWSWLPIAVTFVLVALLLRDCLVANVQPVRFSDEAQIWAAKAKVLFAANTIDLRQGMGAIVAHADYPPLNPLVQVLSFASAGRPLQFENRMPIQAFGVALLLLLSAAVTRRAHPVLATFVLLAWSGTMFWSQTQTAYADVMVAFAMLATTEALLRLRATGAAVWWRLACLSLGALLATKNEGALLALAIAVPFGLAWVLDRRQATALVPRLPRRELGWLVAPALALTLHRAFNVWFDLKNDLLDPAAAGGRGMLDRIVHNGADHAPRVAGFYGRMLLDGEAHRWLPLLFFASSLLLLLREGRRWFARPEAPVFGIAACTTLGYMLVFVGTPSDLSWHMATAASRTLMHVVPVMALGLAMTVWPRRDT